MAKASRTNECPQSLPPALKVKFSNSLRERSAKADNLNYWKHNYF